MNEEKHVDSEPTKDEEEMTPAELDQVAGAGTLALAQRDSLPSIAEQSEEDALRLQAITEQSAQLSDMVSNILKQTSGTLTSITQNLK